MNYLLIDESDPADVFECEGEVLKAFFSSTKIFDAKPSLELIRKNQSIEERLIKSRNKFYNIVQFSAHGKYTAKTKKNLDYSSIIKRRGDIETEIFRPDSIVRTGLQADLFFSTNCQTFNPLFIDVLRHYKKISNFIAPINSPYIGNTLVFSMMFYNILLRKIRSNSIRMSDENIKQSFLIAKTSYKLYNKNEEYCLYNAVSNKIIS